MEMDERKISKEDSGNKLTEENIDKLFSSYITIETVNSDKNKDKWFSIEESIHKNASLSINMIIEAFFIV